ncbi:hypothetical protein P153DRAFT_290167 [Dothidotthia symphoricarpi CBS 119687]|uniref:RING zinc finger-like domain-containing protein n=1 Tax=Dothidotthia symphoricarpi CBS 119687 TaxID=1392245 RepID=A0A6A6AES4_9PLEO|nr:uncharacterized protein P153DRAFT_290167 [Dothidotthia symphoricarpi CBS 119687]KAF2130066.1 hypothetical protein P153DRAFT_290167 [Dothidotthia symphoricarpi CBS 119687]
MPPRAPLTGSFSVSDENNVVVCPLRNHDGSACRKRCTGEKRYRSMQEHIRRAHPEHYISKLPATEESFTLMINTPPQERPPPPLPSSSAGPQGWWRRYGGGELNAFFADDYSSSDPRTSDELRRGSLLPAATAAAALAALHTHRAEYDWDSDAEPTSEPESKSYRPRARFAPTAMEQHITAEEPYYTSTSIQRELLPSSLARSPPGRSSTLPPARSMKPNRPRKSSVGQNARRGKHERQKSREYHRRLSYDRKAFSAEPQTAAAILGKRWEDLIDAAASATEEDSRDLTPVPQSPHYTPHMTSNRMSLPPFIASQFQSYTASPLQHTLTPPPQDMPELQPFPSVESSIESAVSGQNFHMPSMGLSESSPTFPFPVQIYCAACRKLSILRESYACSECICGLCQECVDVLVSEHTRGRAPRCPRCNAIGGKFKPFQLDIR